MKRSCLLALVLIGACTAVITAADTPPTPWQGIQPSIPFRAIWSVEIRDQDGSHDIANCWVEREYLKAVRVASVLERESLGHETVDMLGAKFNAPGTEKLMFVESLNHRLYAVEVESGVIKWVSYYPRQIQYPPYFGEQSIYLVSDETLFSTSREFGLMEWRKPLTFAVSACPVLGESGLLFVPSWENRLFCFDTGGKILTWQVRLDGDILGNPAYEGGLIYVPCTDGNLYCVKDTGEISWKFPTKGPLNFGPRAKEGNLVFASADNSVYSINRYNGAKIWEARIGNEIIDSPEIIGKIVLVQPEGRGITAVALETGKILWEMPYTNAVVGFGKKIIYLWTGAHPKDRLVLGVDQDSGVIVWTWDPKDSIKMRFDGPLKNVNEVNKVFVVNQAPGRLFMLGEKGYYEQLSEQNRTENAARAAAQAVPGATEAGAAAPADGTATEGAAGTTGTDAAGGNAIDDLLKVDDLK